MFQVFTTPAKSTEKAKPSLDWRLTNLIGEVEGKDVELGRTESGRVLICQNLIDLP